MRRQGHVREAGDGQKAQDRQTQKNREKGTGRYFGGIAGRTMMKTCRMAGFSV